MIEIYITSLIIGVFVGIVVGAGITFFAVYTIDTQMEREYGSEFSHGFDKGWLCALEHCELENLKNVKENSK